MSFVKYNHTLANLVVGPQPGVHWSEHLGGVEINRLGMVGVLLLTLLYSFTVNASVEVAFSSLQSPEFHDSGIEPSVTTATPPG